MTEAPLYDVAVDEEDMMETVVLPTIYSVICGVGLLGNGLVIILLLFYEKKKSLTFAFFLNLAAADLSFLCSLPFLACQRIYNAWLFGDAMCKVVFGMYRVNLFTSMLTLTAITLDRFVSIVKVVKVQKYQQRKQRWGGAMCAAIWGAALLLAMPQLRFSSVRGHVCSENYEEMWLHEAAYWLQLLVGFWLPLSAMLLCYAFILNTLIRSKSSQKKKSIRIILTLVVVFIVTQLPFNVVFLMVVTGKLPHAGAIDAVSMLEALAYLHACLNPILYFFMGSQFRDGFWKMLRDLRLAKGRNEAGRETEETSRAISASTKMEEFSMMPTEGID